MRKILIVAFAFLLVIQGFGQKSSSEILLDLKKLKNPGSVLYIAAHPDDENTRLIAYLSKGALIRTAYLSLTRGDGGQNLIGTEKGEYIGLLRTQELLEARKLDGGGQFFTRAVDFGYSKSSEETLEKWNKDLVLEDMVWAIRQFKPDVMITRFPPNNYAGHGHHSASAILAEEAFDKAADPNFAPNQLKFVSVWQPKSLYFNTSTWWDKSIENQAKDNEDFIVFDIGTFNTELGQWHNEIASLSRSKHKSQGFGTTSARGSQQEYLKYVKGEKRTSGLFNQDEVSWTGIKNGSTIEASIDEIIKNYNPQQPENSIKSLLSLKREIEKLDFPQKEFKIKEVNQLIISCLGIYAEALTDREYTSSKLGDNKIDLLVLNPSITPVKITRVKPSYLENAVLVNKESVNNVPAEHTFSTEAIENEISQPYWLFEDFENMFYVKNQTEIGLPQNSSFLNLEIELEVEGEKLTFKQPVEYKWRDRVKGEVRVDYKNYPAVMVTPALENLVFTDNNWQNINVVVKSLLVEEEITIKVNMPQGWEIDNGISKLTFKEVGEEKTITFKVKPTIESSQEDVVFTASNKDGHSYGRGIKTIEYDHITKQVLFPTSSLKVIKLDLKQNLQKIGYLMGAGDEVADLLQNLGIEVVQLTPNDINTTDLSSYSAIIAGIRLYNTEPKMAFCQEAINNYIKNGGTYVIQYNTSGADMENAGPFSFKLSRNRVTKEEATAKILNPNHPIFNTPNKITNIDFDNWVQERGLYFADEWNENFSPLISWNDPEEEAAEGALIVADYGKGAYVYCGISFFRQLPKGVPGAYRLLANILSYKPAQK